MGQQAILEQWDDRSARVFQHALLTDLAALEQMLAAGAIEEDVLRIGAEQEMFLVDRALRPAPLVPEILAHFHDPRITSEIGRFNLEANLSPRPLEGNCLRAMEQEAAEVVATVRETAALFDADVLLAGILPTIHQSDLTLDNLTPQPRYFALDRMLRRMRGDRYEILIRGLDELQISHDNVVLEGCCTSFQIHLQVGPSRFARLYNLAQLITAPVLAAAVNSPALFGHRLWQETRIPVFQHSVDERGGSRVARNHPTRVSFGERWLETSVIEIFREDIARFRVLMTAATEEDALAVCRAGGVPRLSALRLHNGTVWRWNRPCYGIHQGRPHLRIEMRALPAGPSILDEVANAAFFFGLLLAAGEEWGAIERRVSIDDARANFLAAARTGLSAQFQWLDGHREPASALILQQLLPLARAGLRQVGIPGADIERYLGTIEQRVRRDQTGSQWALRSIAALDGHATRESKAQLLAQASLEHQRAGRPVHLWQVLRPEPASLVPETVRDVMSVDLFTVQPGDSVALAASIMDWRHVRHVPVEDEDGRLLGLVSHRDILHMVAASHPLRDPAGIAVREIMTVDPPRVDPDAPLLTAIERMRRASTDCLPVVEQHRLVGIVTSHDVLGILTRLLGQAGAAAAGE